MLASFKKACRKEIPPISAFSRQRRRSPDGVGVVRVILKDATYTCISRLYHFWTSSLAERTPLCHQHTRATPILTRLSGVQHLPLSSTKQRPQLCPGARIHPGMTDTCRPHRELGSQAEQTTSSYLWLCCRTTWMGTRCFLPLAVLSVGAM